jgi:hypothetical protein
MMAANSMDSRRGNSPELGDGTPKSLATMAATSGEAALLTTMDARVPLPGHDDPERAAFMAASSMDFRYCSFPELVDGASVAVHAVTDARPHALPEDDVPTIAAMVAASPEGVRRCNFPEIGDDAPEIITTMV